MREDLYNKDDYSTTSFYLGGDDSLPLLFKVEFNPNMKPKGVYALANLNEAVPIPKRNICAIRYPGNQYCVKKEDAHKFWPQTNKLLKCRFIFIKDFFDQYKQNFSWPSMMEFLSMQISNQSTVDLAWCKDKELWLKNWFKFMQYAPNEYDIKLSSLDKFVNLPTTANNKQKQNPLQLVSKERNEYLQQQQKQSQAKSKNQKNRWTRKEQLHSLDLLDDLSFSFKNVKFISPQPKSAYRKNSSDSFNNQLTMNPFLANELKIENHQNETFSRLSKSPTQKNFYSKSSIMLEANRKRHDSADAKLNNIRPQRLLGKGALKNKQKSNKIKARYEDLSYNQKSMNDTVDNLLKDKNVGEYNKNCYKLYNNLTSPVRPARTYEELIASPKELLLSPKEEHSFLGKRRILSLDTENQFDNFLLEKSNNSQGNLFQVKSPQQKQPSYTTHVYLNKKSASQIMIDKYTQTEPYLIDFNDIGFSQPSSQRRELLGSNDLDNQKHLDKYFEQIDNPFLELNCLEMDNIGLL